LLACVGWQRCRAVVVVFDVAVASDGRDDGLAPALDVGDERKRVAVLPVGNRVYIGGNFTYVGPDTGSGASLSAATGAPLRRFARVDGSVYAAVSDGAGGFFVGGSFTTVGGLPRQNVAHVRADGSVDPAWNPGANDAVSSLAVSGSTLYVGGLFTQIGGRRRHRVAALESATGTPTAWNPDATGVGEPFSKTAVDALAVSGSTVYVGGNFARIGGEPRHDIAALDAATGAATGLNPRADSAVDALAVSGSTVYVGGEFHVIGGHERYYIAALDASTGAATAWNPDPTSFVSALQVSGSTVYAGGNFTSVGGRTRHAIAELSARTGQATSWNPHPSYGDTQPEVLALGVFGPRLYLGGRFDFIGGGHHQGFAAFAQHPGLPPPGPPQVTG
jgi:hypothetical protein